MLPQSDGAFRFFRFSGIQVSVHWSWFLVGAWLIQNGLHQYHQPIWKVAEYLSLFAIVLMHEFGHALACRSVGGQANQIVLWPLGGVAYVAPPERPGAMLWSIAAGPLVNVALFPVTWLADSLANGAGLIFTHPDLAQYIHTVYLINSALLIFNMLPIYPLDGGQIFQSILWFFIGQINSLKVASVIGMLGAAALMILAISIWSIWIMVMALFLLNRAFAGFRYARALASHRESSAEPPPIPKE